MVTDCVAWSLSRRCLRALTFQTKLAVVLSSQVVRGLHTKSSPNVTYSHMPIASVINVPFAHLATWHGSWQRIENEAVGVVIVMPWWCVLLRYMQACPSRLHSTRT
jgi:hypothetical protein